MKITGVIKTIGKTQQVTDNFSKREFVLEIERSTQYPKTILMEMSNAKCSDLDGFAEGQEVNIDFNLRGRQWTNPQGEVKTFNTLQAWRIEATNPMVDNTPQQDNRAPQTQQSGDDDLPF